MAEIALEGVTKRFADGTEAVKRVDFTIADGEFFILVGPSGCGKSTLLNMIAGLEAPTSGEIRVGGRRVNEVDPKDRNMAMVFQSYAIYPHMSVRENLAFPLKLARLAKDEIARRVTRAAQALELEPLLERRPATLSGGQRQRVAMGRALVREPAAFLLDEPLSNLDARLRTQTRTEIARLQRRLRTTTVYVTHDQTEAMTLGHRAAVLRAGEIQQLGSPRELYERPANLFVAGFIGAPAMNLVPGELLGHGGMIAGIRPEHFTTAHDGPIEGRVELREWLGPDLYVHLEINEGTKLVARLDPSSETVEGQRIRLAVDPRRVHLFDAATERRLPH
jgi:multiple sugar transport system ATP-binding protein